MIQNEAQLLQVIEQLGNLYRALQALRARVFSKSPRNFAVLAEGPLEDIRNLQAEVEAYLSRLGKTSAEGTIASLSRMASDPQIQEELRAISGPAR